MSEVDKLPFQPPVNFANAISILESREKDDNLFDLLETDSDSTELWLIQTPSNLDITEVNGNRLYLTGEVTRCKIESNGKEYELWSSISSSRKSEPVVVLKPDIEETNIKSCLKSFSGSISVVDHIAVPSITIPEAVQKKAKIPDGLRQRHVPYGSDSPKESISPDRSVTSKKRKHKHNTELDENATGKEIVRCIKEEVSSPKTPKEKTKRIKKESSSSKSNKSNKKERKETQKKDTKKKRKSK